MIIARSFARIHETNLKVRFLVLLFVQGMKSTFAITEAGSFALVVC